MAKTKKTLWLLAMALCLCAALCACKPPADPTTTGGTEPEDAIYTITVTSPSGRIPEGIVAYVYTDSTKSELVEYRALDEKGVFTFTDKRSDQYVLVLQGVPEGYDVQEMYSLTSTEMEIKLTSSPVTGANATDKVYQMGDVIRDFTITDSDGVEHTISEILKTKQAVVLNFWYTECHPCQNEFPFMQTAYEQYGDKLEIIAMSPPSTGDNVERIKQFKADHGLTFPMALCDDAWQQAMSITGFPTTVVIDRYGVICLMHSGEVTEVEVFLGIFKHFTAEDYQQELVSNVDDLETIEYAEGHRKNPLLTGGTQGFDITVEPGKEYHISVFMANGVKMRIEGASYVVCDGERLEPDAEGGVTVTLRCPDTHSSIPLVIGNTGESPIAVKGEPEIAQGSVDNPLAMELGEVNVQITADGSGLLYYTYTAASSGTLAITVKSASVETFDIKVYNFGTYVQSTLSDDGTEDADGNPVLKLAVNEGDKIQITFESLPDESDVFSEVNINALVAILADEGKIPYSVTVKDAEGNPVPGVEVTFLISGTPAVQVTDEEGLISVELPSGVYTIKLTVPAGYTTEITQYLLTAANPSREIVLTPYAPQDVDYTVTVLDTKGNPIADVTVIIGEQFLRTDEQGVAVFTLPEGSYKAEIIPPSGYSVQDTAYDFGAGSELTVTLRTEAEIAPVRYTVAVVDVFGNPFTDAVVKFVAADGSVKRCSVDDSGEAAVNLVRGSYTVELKLNAGYGYEKSAAQLTASVTSTTIVVAPVVSGTPASVTIGGVPQTACSLSMGGAYVKVTPMGTSYFLFTPTEEGTYKISTFTSGAKIENWGILTAPQQSALGMADNVLTLEVTQVGATYVFAIDAPYTASNVILKIGKEAPPLVEEVYPLTSIPTDFMVEAPAEAVKQYLPLNGEAVLLKGADGFYHLGAEDGPVVMVDLRAERWSVCIASLLEQDALYSLEYADGRPVKKTDYSACVSAYLEHMDVTYGVYGLTDDLMTVLRKTGESAGWWDPGAEGYLFAGVSDLDPNSAWMFLLCTVTVNNL